MSKREQEKVAEQATKSVEVTAQQFQDSINTSLDQTKENVRKSIDEARTQIPKYTNVVKSYQEQALESTGRMVEDYINTQKSIMDSVFSSAAPYYENTYRMYNYWFYPRVPAKLWSRSVSNIVENISATGRINNEILFGSIDAWRFERAQQYTQELSRINTNTARAFENTTRETAAEFSANNRQREVYR